MATAAAPATSMAGRLRRFFCGGAVSSRDISFPGAAHSRGGAENSGLGGENSAGAGENSLSFMAYSRSSSTLWTGQESPSSSKAMNSVRFSKRCAL